MIVVSDCWRLLWWLCACVTIYGPTVIYNLNTHATHYRPQECSAKSTQLCSRHCCQYCCCCRWDILEAALFQHPPTISPSLLEKGGCKNYWMVIHSELKPSSACNAMSSCPLFEPLWILDSDHQNTSRTRNRLPFSCMEVWQDCLSAILASDFNTQMEPYPVISKLF